MIYVSPPTSEWQAWRMQLGRVTVHTLALGKAPPIEEATRLLLQSETALAAFPPIDGEGLVEIPNGDRRACEHGIETAANIIATFTRSGRRITTAWPPVAFLAERDYDKSFLASARGIRYTHRSDATTEAPIKMTPEILNNLRDRLDGIASIADFFSTNHPLGKYREAVRFFEMAFALPASDLEKKLSQFLSSGPLGYRRREVSAWISYRDGAIHADRKKATELTWESDVRSFIGRIEQALLDILFNKADWRNASKKRRDSCTPTFGTMGTDGSLMVTQGTSGTIGYQLLDAWGSFPLDLSSLDSPPVEWWCKIVELDREICLRALSDRSPVY